MSNHSIRVLDPADFGRAVHNRRKELGYTQKYISEMTGISASFISDLENGKATVELGKAMMLASLMGLDITISSR
ncbi:MAG: helix-turn-helix domain-containing protein [Lachnospiraceae bacterium]|jgi:HTH-type transcriptional regulator/antitoxin HipB|nr:helix-turn-helix domain-containing protein [Lachnospiraceae bacterium]